MNFVEWLLYAAACAYVVQHRGDPDIEWHPAADVTIRGAILRGFRYKTGLLSRPAVAHVTPVVWS